jgi:glycosyltransferase involved in cell wall biosynthesis
MEVNSSLSVAAAKTDRLISCSCIIPFYNEGSRILNVLEVLKDVAELSQIVCVDDGSEDLASIWLTRDYPLVTLLRLEKNRGKTAAVKAGLDLIHNEYVLLLDADLDSLNSAEISAAINTIIHKPRLDMIILRRINAGFHSKLNRGDILYAGERILKREDLKAILTFPARGYQLEVLINKYMKDNLKTVYWMPSSARNTYKINKLGLVDGMKAEIDMIVQILACHGPKEYFEQYSQFALHRIPESLD